jgi:hypothetical protein
MKIIGVPKQKSHPEGWLIFVSLSKATGAVEKTRTSTSCDTATSTLRVYQFRHDRTPW